MSKPFEHIKRMESLIKEETDWLSKHANDYDSDTYKHICPVMNLYRINLNN